MKTSFEIIKENINSLEFQLLIGNILSCDKYLNEILKHMRKNEWFFPEEEIKATNDLKGIIVNYKRDRRVIVNDNKPNEKIDMKNSEKFKKNLPHNFKKYFDNYLTPILNEVYFKRILKKEKIRSLFKVIKNSLKKKDIKYKEQIKKIIKNSKIDGKIEKRIVSLLPIIDTLNQKDFRESIKIFNKNKNESRLIRTLTNKKAFHYYVPIYNVEVDEKNIKLNEFIEILDTADFRKKFNKYELYDTFIDVMRNSLYAKTKLVHFKISCIGESKSFDLFKRYYELFIDIISFLQSPLTIELEISQKRFFYFKIIKKYILTSFNHETTLISHWEIYNETKDYFKSFTSLFKEHLDGIPLKILNTLKYKRKAEFSIFKEDKFLYYIIALESLILDVSDWKSKRSKDILMIKKIKSLITYYPEFKNLPKRIKILYKLRHLIVHTGRHIIKIDDEDLRYLRRTITSIIEIYLTKIKYKRLSSVIDGIRNGKKNFYNKEKRRLTQLGLKLNKSYSLKGKIYQNDNCLCDIKAKIEIKDFKKDYFLDPILQNIELIDVPSYLGGGGIDNFYLEGYFNKFYVTKSEVNLTMSDLIALSGRRIPLNIMNKNRKTYRLKTTEKFIGTS
jgi:hypothetical protein